MNADCSPECEKDAELENLRTTVEMDLIYQRKLEAEIERLREACLHVESLADAAEGWDLDKMTGIQIGNAIRGRLNGVGTGLYWRMRED